MRRIAVALSVLTLALSGLLAFKLRAQEAELRRPSGGSGEIEGTEIRLSTRITARVARVLAQKGAAVKKGDLLVALDCADPQAQLRDAEARLASARAQGQVALASAEAARTQQVAAVRSIEASKAQADALDAQRQATQRQAERLEAVGSDVAFASRDQLRFSVLGLEHQVAAAQASRAATSDRAQAAIAQTRAAIAQAEAAGASIGAAEAGLERARLLVAECEIRAPRDAFVEDVPFEAGELVAPGAAVVQLVDLAEVKATFYLPNAELAAARAGAKAIVIADAWPDQRFEGTIRTVALKAEFTPRNIQTRTDRDRLVYPVEVALANPDGKLRAGMPVQVLLPGTGR